MHAYNVFWTASFYKQVGTESNLWCPDTHEFWGCSLEHDQAIKGHSPEEKLLILA